jgi:NADPH-dependent 2,4-dienoyl-CoA reductase/sulfur reductase-like enzyme/rhodanese-related sulfurtransferase
MKYLIIGGVAGGATAAARLRRIDETAEIVVLEKSGYMSYGNCGLPYYIGGVIPRRNSLLLQTPESFRQRLNIEVRLHHEAVAIHPDGKRVGVRTADGREYEETYDKLLLAPGANAVRPLLEGIDSEGIFTLRNVEDTDRIKAYLTQHRVKRAVVVGASFIGLEMAENLHHAGVEVSIVEMGDQVMAPIDFSMAAIVSRHLVSKGVHLHLNDGVAGFERARAITVRLKSGKRLEADMVLLSIGVRPATELARAAGLKIGSTGGIWVDDYLMTSAKDVYAVGDAIEFPHPLTGQPWLNFLAGPANRQGRLVADNMALGNSVKYEGSVGTSVAKVFDLTVSSVGLAAKRLQQLGMEYKSSVTGGSSHAGYYPDPLPLTLKLTFHPVTGRLYGAQCVGYEGVDKRIDQIAMLIKHGGTVYDLAATEQAYAPPYSSAKDPIAIAGYVAANVISGAMQTITWRELKDEPGAVTLIDVRGAAEFARGSIKGAVNIPVDELRERIAEIPRDRPVVLFCAVGQRGYVAQRILAGHGYADVRNLQGGYNFFATAYEQNKATVVKSD